MSIKIASALTLGIVVLAGGALFFWPDLDDESQAHAQQVAQACEKATASPYFDLAYIATGKPMGGEVDERLEEKVSVAGADFHYASLWDDGRESEIVYTGGVGYVRRDDTPWQASKDLEGSFVSQSYGLELTPQGWSICPELSYAEKVGDETLDGTPTTRYTSSNDIDLPNGGDKYTINLTRDYWVDETGLLVQIRMVRTQPPTEGYPGAVLTEETKIIGVGETNTITAPVVP